MRRLRTAVLAGVAAVGVAGTAVAASNDTHVMTVDLPDGSVARIEYQGDVAPKVQVDPAAPHATVRFLDPFYPARAANFERIFAELDRQTAAMMRDLRALPLAPTEGDGLPALAAFGTMPAGTVSYRFVSTSDGSRVCSRSWQWTSQGPGEEPKLVSASSGDCDSDGQEAAARPVASEAKTTAPVPAGRGVAT